MSTFKFDNVEYEISQLPPEAKLQYDMIVVANKRISELQLDMAMMQTALNTYAETLKPMLMAIDAAKQASNSELDTYTQVLQAAASSS